MDKRIRGERERECERERERTSCLLYLAQPFIMTRAVIVIVWASLCYTSKDLKRDLNWFCEKALYKGFRVQALRKWCDLQCLGV